MAKQNASGARPNEAAINDVAELLGMTRDQVRRAVGHMPEDAGAARRARFRRTKDRTLARLLAEAAEAAEDAAAAEPSVAESEPQPEPASPSPTADPTAVFKTEVRTMAEILITLRRAGYTTTEAPAGTARLGAEIAADREFVGELPCPGCERLGMAFTVLWNPRSRRYVAIASCPKCQAAVKV